MPSDVSEDGLQQEDDVIRRPPPHPWSIGRKAVPCRDDLSYLRSRILDLAALITDVCPPSPARSEALAQLDAVAFHAVASFAWRQ
jgi:hypothetical protein